MVTTSSPSQPPRPFRRTMASGLKNFLYKLTPSSSGINLSSTGFSRAGDANALFPATDPATDGEDCLHDCASCTINYPKKFSINEGDDLYGHVKGWSTHLIVATGKSDWVRDVADEKGSIMEAVDKSGVKPSTGRLMLSASNIPIPEGHEDASATNVLLLPAFTIIENVVPSNVPSLIEDYINTGPTNTTPLNTAFAVPNPKEQDNGEGQPVIQPLSALKLKARPCPHKYLILLCSQKTRDARCGQSAPLLRKEFERLLRPLGLYRDLHDERPGGVGIYFISHVGGHKYSANVMIYRKQDPQVVEELGDKVEALNIEDEAAKPKQTDDAGEAAQCIWLARVRPADCENIVKYTILQGKVVKPDSQLRGGFDRSKQLVSW